MRFDLSLRGFLALAFGIAILALPSTKLAAAATVAFALFAVADVASTARTSKQPWTDAVTGLALASVAVFAGFAGFAWVVGIQALAVGLVMVALARKSVQRTAAA